MTTGRLFRRGVITVSVAVLLGAVIGAGYAVVGGKYALYTALTVEVDGAQIDAPTAHRRASAGDLLLVDIRRPEEWTDTGSGAGAIRLDMRRDDFTDALADLVGGDYSRPIAVICARGVRSARLSNRLSDAGFTNIIDVPEGMLGSAAGPGWIARGLPLEKS